MNIWYVFSLKCNVATVLNEVRRHDELRRMEVKLQAFLTSVNDHFHIPVIQRPG